MYIKLMVSVLCIIITYIPFCYVFIIHSVFVIYPIQPETMEEALATIAALKKQLGRSDAPAVDRAAT